MGHPPGRAIQEPIKTKRDRHRANFAKRAGMGTAMEQVPVSNYVKRENIVLRERPCVANAQQVE